MALGTAPQLLDDLPSLSPSLPRQLQTLDSDLSRAPSSHHHAWPTSHCFLFPRPSPILHRRNIATVEIQTSQSRCEHQVILGQGRSAVVHKVDTGVGCASLGPAERSLRAVSGHAHICGQSHAALPLRAGEGQGHCPNSNLVLPHLTLNFHLSYGKREVINVYLKHSISIRPLHFLWYIYGRVFFTLRL